MAQFSVNATRLDPYKNFKFRVKWDGRSGAVLLFDEADALFGKRTDVNDSHDRYTNLEISYLLQRMEAYDGITILTTNSCDSIDPAFIRRLRQVVHFPTPSPEMREAIWRNQLSGGLLISDQNFHQLAQLELVGGDIRNIAQKGNFLANKAGQTMGMVHLLQAVRIEGARIGRGFISPLFTQVT